MIIFWPSTAKFYFIVEYLDSLMPKNITSNSVECWYGISVVTANMKVPRLGLVFSVRIVRRNGYVQGPAVDMVHTKARFRLSVTET